MTNVELIRLLRSGKQKPVKVTFNSIRLKQDLAVRLAQKLEMNEDTLLSMLNNPTLTQKFGFDTVNIVGMFIPNTYEMYWDIGPETLFKRMHHEYEKFWTDERKAKLDSVGLTRQQVTVLASIVEQETRKADEMPRVAGVYLNRLRKGMILQADPTLKFAARNFAAKRVYNSLKEIDSPYNTYMYAGLPPGPIYLPSTITLDAVLNAEDHSYIYFCARPDFSGYHDFAVNYRDQINNARKYQRALNQAGIR